VRCAAFSHISIQFLQHSFFLSPLILLVARNILLLRRAFYGGEAAIGIGQRHKNRRSEWQPNGPSCHAVTLNLCQSTYV
jgi:hypothetical protein